MRKVFLATSETRHAPLTVIARHKDEAFRIAFLWPEAHALPILGDEIWLIELSDDDLEYLPQLADSALSGGVGVAWWTGEQSGGCRVLLTASSCVRSRRLQRQYAAVIS
jgi:hypothetical protein